MLKPIVSILLALLALGTSGWEAIAEPERFLPAAGSVPSHGASITASHGWVALPEPAAQNAFASVLAHVAPRSSTGAEPGAAEGVLFPAVRLESMPAAIAAVDDRVYLLFGPKGVYGGPGYEVLGLRALPTPIAGMYAYEPQGRLEAFASLQLAGDLRGFVGTSRGPMALMHTPGEVNMPRLLRLDTNGWVEVGVPGLADAFGLDATRSMWLLGVSGRAVLVGYGRDGALRAWEGSGVDLRVDEASGAIEEGTPSDADPGMESWAWRGRVLMTPPFSVEDAVFLGVGGVLCAISREGEMGRLTLWSEVGGGWTSVASREGADGRFGVAALGDVSRVVAVWMGESEAGSKDPLRARPAMVWEVSAASGSVMHDGEATRRGPLSSQDLRALVILLLGSTAAVLLFVVKVGDDPGVLTLPEGVELASPSRRMAAALVDLCVALGAVWAVTGATPGAVMDVLRLTPEGMGVMGLIDVVAAGFSISTVMEAAFGRTVGKAMAGCAVLPVVSRDAVDRRGIGLWRAAVRNAIRWGLPPAALLGVFEPGGRHRGDVVGRSVVVSRFEPDEA
jgi:hypothetical protein